MGRRSLALGRLLCEPGLMTAGANRVVIMGAGGRDFHNFNVAYRDDPAVLVVAFTAAQIPGIADRAYPAALAGDRYPDGIPIVDESKLPDLIRRESVDLVVFAYSDVSHEEVMHKASLVLAHGADFALLGPGQTMIPSRKPLIAVCAVRTGASYSSRSSTVGSEASMSSSVSKRWICMRVRFP